MIDPIRDPAYHDYQNKKQSKKVSGSNTEKGKFNRTENQHLAIN